MGTRVQDWIVDYIVDSNVTLPFIPYHGQRFLVNFIFYVMPGAYFFTGIFFLLRRFWGIKWRPPRLYYYALACYMAFSYGRWLFQISRLWNDPTFSLAHDLYGESTRALLFSDHVCIILISMAEIFLMSAERGLPSWKKWLYFALAPFGIGHSLWMADVYARDSGRPLSVDQKTWKAQMEQGRWMLWVFLGVVGFALWVPIVHRFYWTFLNLNAMRRPDKWGTTPGARLGQNYVQWAMFEWMAHYQLEFDSFWQAGHEAVLLTSHAGAYIARRLFVHDFYTPAELKQRGVIVDRGS